MDRSGVVSRSQVKQAFIKYLEMPACVVNNLVKEPLAGKKPPEVFQERLWSLFARELDIIVRNEAA